MRPRRRLCEGSRRRPLRYGDIIASSTERSNMWTDIRPKLCGAGTHLPSRQPRFFLLLDAVILRNLRQLLNSSPSEFIIVPMMTQDLR